MARPPARRKQTAQNSGRTKSSSSAHASRRRTARKPAQTRMGTRTPTLSYSSYTEVDPLVSEYQHDKSKPREAEALMMLKKIASLVKPIMRNRGWRIHRLCEFQTPHLLGLNQRYGSNIKVFLRLRHNNDISQFLPLEQVTDTMLHELAHIVHGPHNAQFQALWNQLRDEHMQLLLKGYTGEGFLSQGHRLGGGLARVPIHEVRRRALQQFKRRQALSAGSGQRVGGRGIDSGVDMRKVLADAAERRLAITQGCASGTSEGDAAAKDASENGFRTKADESETSDEAIAEAYIDLTKEEEAEHQHSLPQSTLDSFVGGGKTLQHTSSGATTVQNPMTVGNSAGLSVAQSIDSRATSTASAWAPWSCFACTFLNPPLYLACSICGTERRPVVELNVNHDTSYQPPELSCPTSDSQDVNIFSRSSHWVEDATLRRPSGSPAKLKRSPGASSSKLPKPGTSLYNRTTDGQSISKRAIRSLIEVEESLSDRPMGWLCPCCQTFMEKQWWSCINCGTVKCAS